MAMRARTLTHTSFPSHAVQHGVELNVDDSNACVFRKACRMPCTFAYLAHFRDTTATTTIAASTDQNHHLHCHTCTLSWGATSARDSVLLSVRLDCGQQSDCQSDGGCVA